MISKSIGVINKNSVSEIVKLYTLIFEDWKDKRTFTVAKKLVKKLGK